MRLSVAMEELKSLVFLSALWRNALPEFHAQHLRFSLRLKRREPRSRRKTDKRGRDRYEPAAAFLVNGWP
jgi:hypothetical protein